MSLSTTPSLLNAFRDGDTITSLGSLFQCLTILSMKNFFLISHLDLPWHNTRQYPLVLLLVTWEKRSTCYNLLCFLIQSIIGSKTLKIETKNIIVSCPLSAYNSPVCVEQERLCRVGFRKIRFFWWSQRKLLKNMKLHFKNIALTSINLNNCKSSSSQLLEQRACVLSTSWLCLGKSWDVSNTTGPCPGEVLAGTARGSIAGSMGVVTPRLCTKSCNEGSQKSPHGLV